MKQRIPILCSLLSLFVWLSFPAVTHGQADLMAELTALSTELMEAQQRGADLTSFIPRIEALTCLWRHLKRCS